MPPVCEDAFFITERGFGVSDGVSGWNDYGFSSEAFSHQLMDFCKEEIDNFINYKKESLHSIEIIKKMRKNGSYLSMENLDVNIEQYESSSVESDEESPEPKKEKKRKAQQQTKKESNEQLKFDNESITLHPIFILERAFSRVSSVGSATAMVAIRNQKDISISNLGDSGFLLIRFRNGEAYVAARSKEQQHSFNIPYQLTILPT